LSIIVVVVCSKSTEVQSVLVEWEGLKGDGKGKGEGKEILYPPLFWPKLRHCMSRTHGPDVSAVCMALKFLHNKGRYTIHNPHTYGYVRRVVCIGGIIV